MKANRFCKTRAFPLAVPGLILAVLFADPGQVLADEVLERQLEVRFESPFFIRQGAAVTTQADVDAYLSHVPEEDRPGVLVQSERLGRMLQNFLLARMVAQRGLDSGLLDNHELQARIYQSAMMMLAEEYRRHYVESRLLDDYTTRAREIYLAEPEAFRESRTVDFSHILVGVGPERSETEAMRRILEVSDHLAEGEELEALVEIYSDDPAAASNRGRYQGVNIDDIDEQMAERLRSMRPGTLSEPVPSAFGWHIVRLNGWTEGEVRSWEDAKADAIRMARNRHRTALMERLYRELLDQPVEIAEGALERLFERYGIEQADRPDSDEIRHYTESEPEF